MKIYSNILGILVILISSAFSFYKPTASLDFEPFAPISNESENDTVQIQKQQSMKAIAEQNITIPTPDELSQPREISENEPGELDNENQPNPTDQPQVPSQGNGNQIIENQGISGKVSLIQGNCMPMIGGFRSTCQRAGLATTIYATNLIDKFEDGAIVAQTSSDSTGNFFLELPEGQYSLFADDNGQKTCSSMNQVGDKMYCNPVTVKPGEITKAGIVFNHAVW